MVGEVVMTEREQVLLDMAEMAWGIIANAGEGDWTRESHDWQKAAARWRDNYHEFLEHGRT